MPIDETNLQNLVLELQKKDQAILNEHVKIQQVLIGLQKICEVDKPIFDSTTGNKTKETRKEKPVDELTNQEMTDKRRQEIYDALKPQAEALLK